MRFRLRLHRLRSPHAAARRPHAAPAQLHATLMLPSATHQQARPAAANDFFAGPGSVSGAAWLGPRWGWSSGPRLAWSADARSESLTFPTSVVRDRWQEGAPACERARFKLGQAGWAGRVGPGQGGGRAVGRVGPGGGRVGPGGGTLRSLRCCSIHFALSKTLVGISYL